MPKLLNKDEFRAALEDAIKGREAKNASFSQAWANGELQRHHFARWAENHYHYVGPFADYLGYIYANTPDYATDAKDFLLQNMYEEELSDIRHTDLLIRFAEACGTTKERIHDPSNMNAASPKRKSSSSTSTSRRMKYTESAVTKSFSSMRTHQNCNKSVWTLFVPVQRCDSRTPKHCLTRTSLPIYSGYKFSNFEDPR